MKFYGEGIRNLVGFNGKNVSVITASSALRHFTIWMYFEIYKDIS